MATQTTKQMPPFHKGLYRRHFCETKRLNVTGRWNPRGAIMNIPCTEVIMMGREEREFFVLLLRIVTSHKSATSSSSCRHVQQWRWRRPLSVQPTRGQGRVTWQRVNPDWSGRLHPPPATRHTKNAAETGGEDTEGGHPCRTSHRPVRQRGGHPRRQEIRRYGTRHETAKKPIVVLR